MAKYVASAAPPSWRHVHADMAARIWLRGYGYGDVATRAYVVAVALFRRDDIKDRLPIRRLLAGRIDRSPDKIWKKQAREISMKIAIPDLISNSYFPAAAAVELGFFKAEGLDLSLELIFPVDKAYAALRDGQVDFVAGSAHSALAAFPEWKGVKLLCAQGQGMYWFLVMAKRFA